MDERLVAPGWPGIPPKWTSSAKSGVGTALSSSSRIWFTLSHGIVNEVYYPRVDQACTRDFQLLVADGVSFFSEEKRDTASDEQCESSGAPAWTVTNRCRSDRFTLVKQICTDPRRDVLIQRVRFQPRVDGLSLFALLAPHLGNRGGGNHAWTGDYKGEPMLFAQRGSVALALASSTPWIERSVGFVGFSDGWQDLSRHRALTWRYAHADDGNVAVTGQVAWEAADGELTLALGFGQNPAEAAQRARASLQSGFDSCWEQYVAEWNAWLGQLRGGTAAESSLARTSRTVVRVHESKRFPGGVIASLSVPWGMDKGDDDLGGYHVVWPRDLVEAAGALLAVGASDEALRVAEYLHSTQESDGHWAQNMWLDGTPYWSGIQMDETAFPILLIDLLCRELGWETTGRRFWPMVRGAASYIVRNGPVTQQDRWEEDPGYSPFTLAVEIAALLAAADFADAVGQQRAAAYLRESADAWNEGIERWSYVTGTSLARQVGVEGYYVRIAPPEEAEACSPREGFVPIKNRPPGESTRRVEELVSPDALALVRFGLRSPDDPRIVDTVRVIDALLKAELPAGPVWYRYNGDGYGEHDDGTPFDGTGTGRPWPLLTGERAHYELAAGRRSVAERLANTFSQLAGLGGMLPEQVWDAGDIRSRGLHRGGPTGSAMPLVWAHAEYLKLLRSITDGEVFDMPTQTVERYQRDNVVARHAVWRFNHRCRGVPRGKDLRIEVLSPARVRWTADGWSTLHDLATTDTGLGIEVADIPTAALERGSRVELTFYWLQSSTWEGVDYSVEIE